MTDLLLETLEGNMICPCCGKHMQIFSNVAGQNNAYSIDHIIELQNGGTNNIDNLQVICFKCNRTKRDNTKITKALVKATSKPVIATDKLGNRTYYKSTMEAERELNIPYANTNISHACLGKYKSAYGFEWRYATTAEIEANKDK